MTPSVFLYLANLDRPRRPPHVPDEAPQAVEALSQLSAPVDDGIAADQLGGLAQVSSDIADAMVGGRFPLPVAPLNALTEHLISFPRLVAAAASAEVRLERAELPTEPVAAVAGRVVAELADADLTRIKECARPECRLIFYDDTRSRTQRWHADAPCGRLERQRRYRAR